MSGSARSVRFWTGALLSAALGCAHRDPAELKLVELNRTVEALRLQNAAYQKQIEELANRVYILDGDGGKSPTPAPRAELELPKVTLHPASKATAPAPEGVTAAVDEPDVEYAGEAARTTTRRPVLRLYGDEMPVLQPARDRAPAHKLTIASEGVATQPPALYKRSLEALRAGHHGDAASGFREFLRLHGGNELADNAQYWLGETYYDQKDYPQAVREFRRVIEKYPQGNKVPDALLKVGFCHLAIGSVEVGRQTLEQLVRTYPQHEAASRASARLAELRDGAAAPQTASSQEVP
jgi:tol-pal system protein YbgF